MRTCLICAGELPDDKYSSADADVCIVCQEKASRVTNVVYAHPARKSRLQSYLMLISAIRERAESDGAVREFERYWIYRPPWPVIWSLLGDLERVETYEVQVI